jgi:hypothetical protein
MITLKLIMIIILAKDKLIKACILVAKSVSNFIGRLTCVRIGKQTVVGDAVNVSI